MAKSQRRIVDKIERKQRLHQKLRVRELEETDFNWNQLGWREQHVTLIEYDDETKDPDASGDSH
jgi:glucose-6-phosphate dehydrogenase assembly protein OpcA